MSAPKVLLHVEDDAVREAIVFALKVEGIQTAVCAGIDDLGSPDDRTCLVIDQVARGSVPADQLRAIRAGGWHAPVIVLINTPPATQRRALVKLGATLVEKPLLCDELVATIRAVTDGTSETL